MKLLNIAIFHLFLIAKWLVESVENSFLDDLSSTEDLHIPVKVQEVDYLETKPAKQKKLLRRFDSFSKLKDLSLQRGKYYMKSYNTNYEITKEDISFITSDYEFQQGEFFNSIFGGGAPHNWLKRLKYSIKSNKIRKGYLLNLMKKLNISYDEAFAYEITSCKNILTDVLNEASLEQEFFNADSIYQDLYTRSKQTRNLFKKLKLLGMKRKIKRKLCKIMNKIYDALFRYNSKYVNDYTIDDMADEEPEIEYAGELSTKMSQLVDRSVEESAQEIDEN